MPVHATTRRSQFFWRPAIWQGQKKQPDRQTAAATNIRTGMHARQRAYITRQGTAEILHPCIPVAALQQHARAVPEKPHASGKERRHPRIRQPTDQPCILFFLTYVTD